MNLVVLIFAGVIIGLIGAAPIGPVNLICIVMRDYALTLASQGAPLRFVETLQPES